MTDEICPFDYWYIHPGDRSILPVEYDFDCDSDEKVWYDCQDFSSCGNPVLGETTVSNQAIRLRHWIDGSQCDRGYGWGSPGKQTKKAKKKNK